MYGLTKKPFIAVDFDGTVVTFAYPGVGEEVGATPWLKRWVAAGAKLILFTMRTGKELEDARAWYAERDIPLWGVQLNPEQHEWTDSNKPYAKLYIDDHGFGTPLVYGLDRPYVDWSVVGPTVLEVLEKRGN